jgi:hypothetical protein
MLDYAGANELEVPYLGKNVIKSQQEYTNMGDTVVSFKGVLPTWVVTGVMPARYENAPSKILDILLDLSKERRITDKAVYYWMKMLGLSN